MNVQELIDETILKLPDNTSGAITPEVLRNILQEFAVRSEIKVQTTLNLASELDEATLEAFSLLTLRSLNQLVDIISINPNNSLRIDGLNGEMKMKADVLLEAIVGGQINLTSGDSTTIDSGSGLVLKSSLQNVTLQSMFGEVLVKAFNQLFLEGNGISIASNNYIQLTSGDYVQITAPSSITVTADGNLFLESVGEYVVLNGKLRSSLLPIYTNDASADADVDLLSGSWYKLTGSRTIFQKP